MTKGPKPEYYPKELALNLINGKMTKLWILVEEPDGRGYWR